MADWLANIAHETKQLTKFSEDLWYSPARLVAVWPSRFYLGTPVAGKHDANEYSGNPEKLANLVYGNRYGNGDEHSGYGWKYRGRGTPHLTFHDNYKRFGEAVGADLETNPDWVGNANFSALAGGWFWRDKDLSTLSIARQFTLLVSRWNGGNPSDPKWRAAVGLDSRLAFRDQVLKVLP